MSARTGFTILVCFLSACTGDQVIVRTNTVVCGNGELETGEECDDNNDNNFDACTNACEFAACGDGVVRNDLDAEDLGYEECDDGNDNNNDYCRNDCLPAICGDGIIRTDLAQGSVGFEACDDANIDPNDECTNECKRARCGDASGLMSGLTTPDTRSDDGNDLLRMPAPRTAVLRSVVMITFGSRDWVQTTEWEDMRISTTMRPMTVM